MGGGSQGTAVKPLVYLFLIMASTEPQKLLFWGVPGGALWSEYVTTTNFHVGKNNYLVTNHFFTVRFCLFKLGTKCFLICIS